jgi:DNA-binding protein H-NS
MSGSVRSTLSMGTRPDFSEREQKFGTSLKSDFEQMSVEDLWHIRDELTQILSKKLNEEKGRLEKRLSELSGDPIVNRPKDARRPYPEVQQKYRDPANPTRTWSGRGRQPGWVIAHLESGKKLEELLI